MGDTIAGMDIAAMRRADRWLGVPACFVLTCVRRAMDGLRPGRRGHREARGDTGPEASTAAARRILFVKLAEQGSTVLAYSALRRAIEKVGRENVYFLAFQENRFILDAMELIPEENVVTISTGSLGATLGGALRAVKRLRHLKIDDAVDLEFFARSSAALSYLSGATQRVGFHAFGGEASYRADLMTHRLSYNAYLHTSQVFRLLVDALECDPDLLPAIGRAPPAPDDGLPTFHARPEEIKAIQSLLHRETGRHSVKPLVLLNANCSDFLPLRRWPSERYVELARRLLAWNDRLYVAFTGGPNEAEAVRGLVETLVSDRCICLAGKTTLRELLVLYSLSDVLVTNDSGPAHFATLTPIRVVTLFGPETPALFGARTPRNAVLWAGLPCSPCVNAFNDRRSACRNNLCMKAILVDQVFEAVRSAIEEKLKTESGKLKDRVTLSE